MVSGATLASRIMGFCRDVIIAKAFGAGLATDAFFVAFRVPYLFRRFLGEGSLTASFIPVFTKTRERGKPGEDREMVASATGVLLLVVLGISLLAMAFAPALIRMLAPGFAKDPEKLALTIALTRIVCPYLIFVSFFALYMGVLNATGHFFAPAAAPVFLSVGMIAGALWLAPHMSRPIDGLAWGVLLGGVLQMLFQFPYMRSRGYLVWPRFWPPHPAVRKVMFLMVPALMGLAANEINLMMDTLMASFLREGSVSYLYYGNRLVQFPLGLIGIALGTAIFPTLSADAARMDMKKLKETMIFGLRMVFFLTLPAMVGLIVLSKPIIALLFQRGEFSADSTRYTAQALVAYALGLWAYTGVRILVPAFYSLQDTRTPLYASLISIASNIVMNYFFAFVLGMRHAGLALATSIAGAVNLFLLVYFLRRKIGPLGLRRFARLMVKPLLASAAMAGFCLLILWGLGDALVAGMRVRMGEVFIGVAVGGIIYFALARLMRTEELRIILETVGWSKNEDVREEDIA